MSHRALRSENRSPAKNFLWSAMLVAVYTPVALLLVLFSPFHFLRLMSEKFLMR
ncbi:MAG: hypothetical protein IFNCLDLE_00878 [Ignavibacteriaceae bacterium]|nr:hypothetical protein [Ignavibacteriaceae bacterium]